MKDKIKTHCRFWEGEGHSLILLPAENFTSYDTERYDRLFSQPRLMWESQIRRARPLVTWPTDGIPTIRPNLGVIFIPSLAGQAYQIKKDQMPWPGEPLPKDHIRQMRSVDVKPTLLMRLAEEFYRIHASSRETEITVSHPDTQGVFDIAHLLYGNDIFLAMAGTDVEQDWFNELMEICLDLYVRTTVHVKEILKQKAGTMIHGNGRLQGIYFPHAGARVCEDTTILISPDMIERLIIPFIERSVTPFGGCFVHFCGYKKSLFDKLCQNKLVRAIDLGNPEMYETSWLLERCARTDTVLYSRLMATESESAEAYVKRLASAVRDTRARCILRSDVTPSSRGEAETMIGLWHELTVSGDSTLKHDP